MKDEIKVKKGKASRVHGNAFEVRVRLDLEEKGWICDKWTNNVDLDYHSGGHFVNGKHITKGKLVKAKAKYLFINGSMRMVGNNSGFPDFIAFRNVDSGIVYEKKYVKMYEVIGVEAKMNGELTKEEKEQCVWLLNQKIFSKILIASKHKIKNRIHIEYEDFKIKYHRFYK